MITVSADRLRQQIALVFTAWGVADESAGTATEITGWQPACAVEILQAPSKSYVTNFDAPV